MSNWFIVSLYPEIRQFFGKLEHCSQSRWKHHRQYLSFRYSLYILLLNALNTPNSPLSTVFVSFSACPLFLASAIGASFFFGSVSALEALGLAYVPASFCSSTLFWFVLPVSLDSAFSCKIAWTLASGLTDNFCLGTVFPGEIPWVVGFCLTDVFICVSVFPWKVTWTVPLASVLDSARTVVAGLTCVFVPTSSCSSSSSAPSSSSSSSLSSSSSSSSSSSPDDSLSSSSSSFGT